MKLFLQVRKMSLSARAKADFADDRALSANPHRGGQGPAQGTDTPITLCDVRFSC
jgi:hypothetical protein